MLLECAEGYEDARRRVLVQGVVAARIASVLEHCFGLASLLLVADPARACVLGRVIPRTRKLAPRTPHALAWHVVHAWASFVIAGYPEDDCATTFLMAAQYTRRLFEAGVVCESEEDRWAAALGTFAVGASLACKFLMDNAPDDRWIYCAVHSAPETTPDDAMLRELYAMRLLDFDLGDKYQ